MQEERVPDRGVCLGLEGLKSRGWRRTPSIKNGTGSQQPSSAQGEDRQHAVRGFAVRDAIIAIAGMAGLGCHSRREAAEAARNRSSRLAPSTDVVLDDTRMPDGQPSPTGASGVGSGFIALQVDGEGRPIAYLFAPPADAEYSYRPIAIGRAEPF